MCTVFPTNKTTHAIHPNETNRPTRNPPNETNCPHAICPNETVGAVPVCPPERPRSGVSIPKYTHCARGNERWMRPCGATRAGTQAPPLPISIIFFRAIPHKQNNHLHTIHPNEIKHPNETRIQSTHTSGAEMHRALPPPFFKTSCVCKLASR